MNSILGLDPGRDKCGVAIKSQQKIIYHQVIDSKEAIFAIEQLCQTHNIDLIVMGDGTTSKAWCKKIEANMSRQIAIVTVDERNSTVEARDRYWLMYPPKGLQKLVPLGLRVPPRPVDDIVAILLIERYLNISRSN
ncbi:MAG: pre-16S rRNA-processing nuclease YqgF [Cyanobacteria bacterium P01_G01_bin.19]